MNIKRITVIDTLFPPGHKGLNNQLIKLLPKSFNILIGNNNDNYFDRIEGYSYVEFSPTKTYSTYYKLIIAQLINFYRISLKTKSKKENILILLAFENISFALARFFFREKKKILFHHDNVDYLKINYVRFFFKSYMNHVYHVVFAEFIKDRLITIGVNPTRIYVLTHPIKDITPTNLEVNISKLNTFLGVGFASDRKLLQKIVDYEFKTKLLQKNNIKLLLRSSEVTSNCANIEIINKYMTNIEYQRMFENSKGILSLYPSSYQYRFSGAILDAIVFKKFVIGPIIPIVQYFESNYKNTCYTFQSIDDLFVLLVKLKDEEFHISEYHDFIKKHDILKVKNDIEKIIFS